MLDELIATSSPAHIVRATVRHAARAYEERLGLEHVPNRQLPAHGDEGLVVLAARYEEQIHGLIRNYLRMQGAVSETAAASSPFPVPSSAHHRYWRAMKACGYNPVLAREWAHREGLTGRELQDMADNGDDMAASILDQRIERWEREGLDVAQQLDDKTARGLSRAQFDAIHSAIHYVSVDDVPVVEADSGDAVQTVGDMLECPRSSAELAGVENRDLVQRLLAHVSPREREALKYLTGLDGPELSVAETARVMGVDPGRVRSLKASALKKLRKVVAEMEV